jgi:DNA-binding winged helix-turn-helix (wHTH) protein
MSTSYEQYETYTVKVDSRGAPANNSFVGYIDIPLRNVVKVQLLSASLDSNLSTTTSLYVHINELVSKFNDKASIQTAITTFSSNTQAFPVTSNIGPNPTSITSNVSQLRTSLVCIPTDQIGIRTIFTVGAYWNTEVEFIEPIRQVQYLTVSIFNAAGDLASLPAATFLNLRFTCAKRNTCLY